MAHPIHPNICNPISLNKRRLRRPLRCCFQFHLSTCLLPTQYLLYVFCVCDACPIVNSPAYHCSWVLCFSLDFFFPGPLPARCVIRVCALFQPVFVAVAGLLLASRQRPSYATLAMCISLLWCSSLTCVIFLAASLTTAPLGSAAGQSHLLPLLPR